MRSSVSFASAVKHLSSPDCSLISSTVADYMSSFQLKITPFLDAKLTLSDAEMIKFGKKDTEQYPFEILII